jgi:type I restriction enzyme R subunit
LISHLKSNNASETLIVTSIQKMSRVNADNLASQREVEKIRAKRLVFIVDECHRSTFGEMLSVIKLTFPNAIFFGFSGTPIWDKNKKHTLTTSDVFGPELHRYTIRNGIEDKNVLGFDPYMIETFSEHDLRVQIGLDKSKSSTVSEALSDPQKRAIFYHYQDSTQVPMVSSVDSSGNSVVGIEDLIPNTQYKEAEHQNAVVDSIIDNWEIVSHANKFHAILATSSIPEAIDYYHIFKKRLSEGKCTLRVTALFDKSTDGNDDKVIFKEDSLVEILTDYNEMYGQSYTIPTYSSFKVDVSERLAHKDPYKGISEKSPERLDLLIVVNQMLTGYDSHFLNALYLDKVLEYEGIIQAFSRTNRLCGPEKPFGIVKYYRKPHTMARNIEKAFDLYSGNQAFGIFVDKLEKNLNGVNEKFDEIKTIFESAGIPDFASLPKENEIKAKFANLFKELNQHLDAATIQGFTWKRMTYEFKDDAKTAAHTVTLHLDEKTYEILALRYKELFSGHSGKTEDVPYDIDSHLLEINTDAIDADYMNSRFTEYVKALHTDKAETILQELHKSFASLTQEEQKQAKVFLQDVQLGSIVVDSSKTFREYLTEYLAKARNDMIHRFAFVFGLDETLLRKMMNAKPNPANIDEFGRFSSLESTGDIVKAQNYFESKEGKSLKKSDVFAMFDDYLRRFVLEDGFDI